MKRVFNNQKGYSLVELLVAMAIFAIVLTQIFAMMQHSARLYKNGTYEVDLQTEAQQFVQQMEELLIDVNVSVNETGTPSSNYTIQIINTDQTYTVEFAKDPAAEFGEVHMSASGNITAADMPMAEYVQSVSLDMTEYTSADKVVLCVSMNNGKYSYETSKDIYLRNGVGSGTGGAMNVPEGDFDEELDVLRFKDYNLTDLYHVEGVVLDFIFEDGTLMNDEFKIYQNAGSWHLECKSTLNAYAAWDSASSKYNILAVDHDNPSSVQLKIQIGTKEVKVLPDGYGIAFVFKDNDENGARNAVQVQGIDMTAATSAGWTMYWHTPGGDLSGQLRTGLTLSGIDGTLTEPVKNNMGGGQEIKFDRLEIKIADIDSVEYGYNGLMVYASGVDKDYYQYALEQGKGYYINACFRFPGCSSTQTFNINIFFAPSSTDALSNDAIENFWNMCFAASF
ncbi:MAG: type II secretion system GspH family protein [Lachnospiraceae bacterium]|nr:type II secretion system GspH family protein [Lachnospiraceae bacterium]